MRAKTHSGHDHDHGYKRLFSHPQAVEELIRGFLRPEWAEGLDLSTLERIGNDFISDDLRERKSDAIWRMRRKGEWLYLLLELQSTSHPFMALRMLTYACPGCAICCWTKVVWTWTGRSWRGTGWRPCSGSRPARTPAISRA